MRTSAATRFKVVVVAAAILLEVSTVSVSQDRPAGPEEPPPDRGCSSTGEAGLPRCPPPPPPVPPRLPEPSANASRLNIELARTLAQASLVEALRVISREGTVNLEGTPSGVIDLDDGRWARWYFEDDYWPLRSCVERCIDPPFMTHNSLFWYALYPITAHFKLDIWEPPQPGPVTISMKKSLALRVRCVDWSPRGGRIEAIFLRSGLSFTRPTSLFEDFLDEFVIHGLSDRIDDERIGARLPGPPPETPDESQPLAPNTFVPDQPASCSSLGVRRGATRFDDAILFDEVKRLSEELRSHNVYSGTTQTHDVDSEAPRVDKQKSFYSGARAGIRAVAQLLEDLSITVTVDGIEERREIGRDLARKLVEVAELVKTPKS